MIGFIKKTLQGFRRRITLIVITGIIRVAGGLLFVALSKRAVDIATRQGEGNLKVCLTFLIAVLIFELISSAVCNRTIELTEKEMKNSLQERLFHQLLQSEWNGQENFHSGDMLSRLTEDCRIAGECLCRMLPTVIIALVQLTGAFIFLCYFNPSLALMLSLVLPIFLFSGKIFFRRVRSLTEKIRSMESRLHESMQESLHHRLLLMTYRFSGHTIKSLRMMHNSLYDSIRKRTNLTVYSRTVVAAGFETGYLIAFIWGIVGLRSGTVSFGVMTAYLQLAGVIQRPIGELSRLLPGIIQAHTAFSRLIEIDSFPFIDDLNNCDEPSDVEPVGIDFRNVSFSYRNEGKPIINNFTHLFLPGSFTAIVGETGVGKSTLLRLMLSLLKPQKGEIIFMGKSEGKRISEERVLNNIVYVAQGNTLLSGSIRRNLKIGKPDATDEEMYAALHDAAADFVKDLKHGLDTECGEHGEGFSEGEAQRIAIARGLLRRGSVFLLDEISSSLDEETEKLLMNRLSTKRGYYTIILVTHRKDILIYCDDILHLR